MSRYRPSSHIREDPGQRHILVRNWMQWDVHNRAHNPKVGGSNPPPATKLRQYPRPLPTGGASSRQGPCQTGVKRRAVDPGSSGTHPSLAATPAQARELPEAGSLAALFEAPATVRLGGADPLAGRWQCPAREVQSSLHDRAPGTDTLRRPRIDRQRTCRRLRSPTTH